MARRTFANFLCFRDVLFEYDGNGGKQTGVIIRDDLSTPISNPTSRDRARVAYPVHQITPFGLDGVGFVRCRLVWS